ncbi:MAG TPA: GWxTD domain-containing protein [Acidobacteriota bacterium]|nr:GWxTD domain-containing protein [Acidobacteriota bacterium]
MDRRLFLVPVILLWTFSLAAQDDERARQEESTDYYKKWLDEDVQYIITEAEKEIFEKLQTAEEKEQFIEQFWLRRDPDPRTPGNEYKEEHYRRIAYANDHFKSGFAGWKTDRGRIYIIHGAPDEIERNPSGGGYERRFSEGGGATATYPFERWWYRHLPGIGDNIELEFVDRTWTGEYRLALDPNEKDLFLYIPGHGNTRAENIGMADRNFRITTQLRSGGSRELYPMMHHRAQDSVFARYETFTRVKQPTDLKYDDLKQAVSASVNYDDLPYRVQEDYFRISGDRYLVPVTVEFPNRELSFQMENGNYVAKIVVYGIVSTITNKVVAEFEEDLIASFAPGDIEKGRTGRTLFQKLLPLKGRMRYKLTLVAKDVNGAKIGVVNQGITPPAAEGESLDSSSLVVADYIRQADTVPADFEEQQFILGDLIVRPTLTRNFPQGGTLGLYMQVYNAALDQTTRSPALGVTYRILRDGQAVHEIEDVAGTSLFFYSDQRVVLVKGLPLKDLPEGKYSIEVEVEDHITGQDLSVSGTFNIVPTS